eukprot:1640092-Pyramimonas_sp.AAC.1
MGSFTSRGRGRTLRGRPQIEAYKYVKEFPERVAGGPYGVAGGPHGGARGLYGGAGGPYGGAGGPYGGVGGPYGGASGPYGGVPMYVSGAKSLPRKARVAGGLAGAGG